MQLHSNFTILITQTFICWILASFFDFHSLFFLPSFLFPFISFLSFCLTSFSSCFFFFLFLFLLLWAVFAQLWLHFSQIEYYQSFICYHTLKEITLNFLPLIWPCPICLQPVSLVNRYFNLFIFLKFENLPGKCQVVLSSEFVDRKRLEHYQEKLIFILVSYELG